MCRMRKKVHQVVGRNRMKAILINENQRVCLFMSQAYVLDGNLNKIHRMCPLRPLPHKLQADWYTDGYKEGFNACLEEITGETE